MHLMRAHHIQQREQRQKLNPRARFFERFAPRCLRSGFWTLPAGFMELGETTAQAARRETLEEAGARVELLPLFSLLNVVRAHQVHLFYRARLIDLDVRAGDESLE